MKSRMLALFLCTSTILTMNPPMSAQDSAKRVSPIKSCKVTNEEVEVYADFLRGQRDPSHLTVLVTSTDARDYGLENRNWQLAAQGHGIPLEIRADFQTKNDKDCRIEPFSGVLNLKFISRSEEHKILAGGWTEFEKRYGKGSDVDTVSRVGFNQDKNLALLHVLGAVQGGGAGVLYLLERKDKAWTVKWYIQTAGV